MIFNVAPRLSYKILALSKGEPVRPPEGRATKIHIPSAPNLRHCQIVVS